MLRYIQHIGPDTLASDLLSPDPAAGEAPSAEACQGVPRWLVEGWWTAVFEWGRNAFLAADFDGASRALLAAWSFVQDQAHSVAAGSYAHHCQHCAVAAAQRAAGGGGTQERAEDCWVTHYLRNLCTQAHLAKEDEEAAFLL